MPQRYSITRLAEAVGVTAGAVRYYERRGLFAPSANAAGHVRVYGESHARQLQNIRLARRLGFSVPEIRKLLNFAVTRRP